METILVETILVGIDDSANAREALRWALDHARPDDEIVAVHTWDLPPAGGFDATFLEPAPFEEGARLTAGDIVADVVAEAGVDPDRVTVRVLRGTSARTLLDEARSADLLVVGARGHGGFVGLILGSVTSSLVNHSPCPIVVVPARSED